VLTSPQPSRRTLRGSAKLNRDPAPDRSPVGAASAAIDVAGTPTAVSPTTEPAVEGGQTDPAPNGATGPPPGPAPDRRGIPAADGAGMAPAHARRDDGRTMTRRQERASRRGLRIDQRLWSISPWSVFKVSALFYFCVALMILVAGTLLYNAGRSVGTIDEFENFITRMGAYGECTPTAEVAEGTEFRQDDKCGDGEVLVGGFLLDDSVLFRAVVIGGGILVVAGTIGNVLLIVLLNLLNELTGGIRHTVIREPSGRSPSDSPPRGSATSGAGPGGPRQGARARPGDTRIGSPPAAEQH
jgi:hypothetical protein